MKDNNGQISIMEQGSFEFWTAHENGLSFSENTPREVWLQATKELTEFFANTQRAHVRCMFFLGDALNFGQAKFGEEFSQAIEDTRKVMHLAAKTAVNAAWISGSIAADIRREALTFSHHECVAKLEPNEQARLLEQAEREDLSVADLKKRIKDLHPKAAKAPKAEGETTEEVSEEEALGALEKVLVFLNEAEDKEAFAEWGAERRALWGPGLAEIAQSAARFVKMAKAKAAKKAAKAPKPKVEKAPKAPKAKPQKPAEAAKPTKAPKPPKAPKAEKLTQEADEAIAA